jgi:AdoMet-dependent heme synthase
MQEVPRCTINPGVFSRIYRWPDKTVAIAYHTPSRSASTLEGDSAEVWWRLFQSRGATDSALEYMLAHGEFGAEARAEALATLQGFAQSLEGSNLIEGPRNHGPIGSATRGVADLASPERNIEQTIGQMMGDHRVCYSLTLETTYRCNERCVHCYLPDETHLNELSLDQIDRLFGEFDALGGFSLGLTGGEVGVRKDFADILDLARKYGFLTGILSNLTRFSDAMLARIIEHRPKSVSCSLYSADPALHDGVTRLEGSFQRSLRAIETLREGGVTVAIKTPLMKHTVAGWREVEALAERLGCGFQMDLSITAKNDGGQAPLGQRVQDLATLQDVFSSPLYRITIMNEPLGIAQGPDLSANLCGAGAASLVVSPDGTVRPCIGMTEALGQFPADSLSGIWHNAPFFQRWAALTLADVPCGHCANFRTCSRCPGAWHAEHGSYTQPTEYNCFLARAWSGASRQGTLS